jgi:hypothetical protein
MNLYIPNATNCSYLHKGSKSKYLRKISVGPSQIKLLFKYPFKLSYKILKFFMSENTNKFMTLRYNAYGQNFNIRSGVIEL